MQKALEQEKRDLDMLRAMTMQGQSEFNWASMTGKAMHAQNPAPLTTHFRQV